jgi:hypothetical protein
MNRASAGDFPLSAASRFPMSSSTRKNSASPKAKIIFVGRGIKVEEKGPSMGNLECVARAILSDTEGPKDEVEGSAVEAGGQAGPGD